MPAAAAAFINDTATVAGGTADATCLFILSKYRTKRLIRITQLFYVHYTGQPVLAGNSS